MKINNLGLASTPQTPQPGEASAITGEQGSQAATSPEVSAYTPSAELVKLVSLVGQQPEIRSEVVQSVLQRLQQGHYQTATAAQSTAEAMLGAVD